jgi:multidrug resistance efflux pump
MGRVADTLKNVGLTLDQQQRREVATLDGEFEEMEAEINRLNTKILHLEAKVNPLERQIEGLKQQVENKKASTLTLEQTEMDILKMLSDHGELPASAIARYTNLNVTRIEYFMGNLDKQKYIHAYYVSDMETTYALAQKGKEFLVKNGLV